MRIEGVFVANVSFFQEDGSFDEKAARNHLEFLASKGVNGFVPCGTTSESPTLSNEERRASIRIAREVADKHGLKVIAGCGGNYTAKVAELLIEAKELGADAALVVSPYYNKPTQAGVLAHFRTLADKSPLPIVLYNIPGRTHVNLSPAVIAQLFAHPNIVGVKESTGDYDQFISIASMVDLKNRALLAGDDNAFAAIMSLGGSGIISATANVAPEPFVQIFAAAQKKDWEKAYEIQKRIQPLVTSMFLETNPAPVKYALSVRLKTNPSLRLPLVETSEPTRKAVENTLRALELNA